ncbi:MAG: hypothetical protein J6O50_10475, partial [Ruminiclostridium sp.]|nr:hypothetical protein [Ruminiclostridium sp.]
QAIYSLKINGKMSVLGSITYMWKILHMPMEFFSQRMAGDIQQRQGTNAAIAGTLVNTLVPMRRRCIGTTSESLFCRFSANNCQKAVIEDTLNYSRYVTAVYGSPAHGCLFGAYKGNL